MHPIRSRLSLSALLTVWALPLVLHGQIPDVPPPTMDQEGTEQAWDITHPGWRQWNNHVDDSDDSNESQSSPSAQLLQSVIEEKRREQEKKQQEERLQQLQALWQEQGRQQQQVQQQQQAQQQQQVFERARQLLLASLQRPAEASMPAVQALPAGAGDAATLPYVASFGSAVASMPGNRAGLSANEWQQARQYQGLIETLSQSPAATLEDRTLVDIAEVRRNQLWSKAASVPGLPDDDREALALRLPVVTTPNSPRLTLQDAGALQKTIQSTERPADTVVTAMLSDLYVYTTSEGAALAGEVMVKRVLDEEAAGRFGDFLGVSKIALATAQDGASSGIAATADFFVGKIPIPQATLAVTGGRQYANVAYQVQSKFMVDAMKAVGADFDVQEFWRNFNEELGTGQKAVMEFVSYGPQN